MLQVYYQLFENMVFYFKIFANTTCYIRFKPFNGLITWSHPG